MSVTPTWTVIDPSTMHDLAWRVRVTSTGRDLATAYVRHQQVEIGSPLPFDPEDSKVTALEYVLAALGADLINGFQTVARQFRILVDGIEATVQGQLNNPLTHLGVIGEQGHPGLERITVRVYLSTDTDEDRVRLAWRETLNRSPLARTFESIVALDLSIAIVE